MEIQEKNVIAAYQGADESGKNLLKTLFPTINFDKDNRPVTERIKTFDDAVSELQRREEEGDELAGRLIADWENFEECKGNEDLEAYIKLRIVIYALNEGWQPKFTTDEVRWYPWHYLWTAEELEEKDEEWKKSKALIPVGDYQQEGWAGFAFAYSNSTPSYTAASIGSRLCLKSSELAAYCGTQFCGLWADFKLIRK